MTQSNGTPASNGWVQFPYSILRHPDLSPFAKLTWPALKSYADEDGKCFPSYETLADGIGISKRQIIRCVSELEKAGLLVVKRRKHRPNLYHLRGVTVSHPNTRPGVTNSHRGVTDSHYRGDCQSPELEPTNKNQEQEGDDPPATDQTSDDFEMTAEGLAQHFCFTQKGQPRDSAKSVAENFAELIRLGVKPAKLRESIDAPGRRKTERIWDFEKRFTNGDHYAGGKLHAANPGQVFQPDYPYPYATGPAEKRGTG